jgi:hypothetical protein
MVITNTTWKNPAGSIVLPDTAMAAQMYIFLATDRKDATLFLL